MACDDLAKKCKAGDKKACDLYKKKCGKVSCKRHFSFNALFLSSDTSIRKYRNEIF